MSFMHRTTEERKQIAIKNLLVARQEKTDRIKQLSKEVANIQEMIDLLKR